MLDKLISFDIFQKIATYQSLNLSKIIYIVLGLVHLVHNSDKTKSNLYANVGPTEVSVILSGHTDVVPIDGQNWNSDPFKEIDGKIYGEEHAIRSFIAICLALVPDMLEAKLKDQSISLQLYEEVGCIGALL